MRPHLTLFAAILVVPALTGCKQSVKQRLQGRWVGEQAINFPANQTRSAGGWARGASFEFQGNRVTVSIPAESPRQGTFKVTGVFR